MRDRNSQRPVYLLNVAQGHNRVADLETYSRVTASLRADKIPFKVLSTRNVLPGHPDVIVLAEEYKAEAFSIALANKVNSVIYLAFDRTAYLQHDTSKQGGVLGQLKAVAHDHAGPVYIDNNRNQTYAIV